MLIHNFFYKIFQHFWNNFLYKINILITPIGIKKFFTHFCISFIHEHFCRWSLFLILNNKKVINCCMLPPFEAGRGSKKNPVWRGSKWDFESSVSTES